MVIQLLDFAYSIGSEIGLPPARNQDRQREKKDNPARGLTISLPARQYPVHFPCIKYNLGANGRIG